jgi:NADH-quinone oxidoreductase subunit E
MSTQKTLKKFNPQRDNLLLILHALQDNNPQNYLTEEDLDATARYLKLTKSSVYGVARYYSMFSLKPRGKYIIRVCVSPVCELLKVDTIVSDMEKLLEIKTGETTSDGLFTLELSECLGQCQEAPSMMINKEVFNNLTPERIREIISEYRKR